MRGRAIPNSEIEEVELGFFWPLDLPTGFSFGIAVLDPVWPELVLQAVSADTLGGP